MLSAMAGGMTALPSGGVFGRTDATGKCTTFADEERVQDSVDNVIRAGLVIITTTTLVLRMLNYGAKIRANQKCWPIFSEC